MEFDKEVDTRGLNCPLPILRLKKMLAGLRGGQVVRVLATDPSSVKDFEAFTRQTGHELLLRKETPDRSYEFFIRHK
ncbi:MAG: sulfurtransferase TusA family protein [Azoarcus sp.]|jgi:tRNA 2-thiouridine synthesizing protein A|nr:sulfurtransferase TusA family protein [Azoarcus sp.]